MPHPYQATLDLLRVMIDRLPPRFPDLLASCARERLDVFAADAHVHSEALDAFAGTFGALVWPYRRAWEEVFAQDGAAIVERAFLEALPPALRAHVERDAAAAQEQPSGVLRLPAFEAYTPEDRLVAEEAYLAARHNAAGDLAGRIASGNLPRYDAAVLRWKEEGLRIEGALLELRALARTLPRWADEIGNIVREYELGFTGTLGREPTLDEVRGAVADYRGRQ